MKRIGDLIARIQKLEQEAEECKRARKNLVQLK
jgi:hypothetical protein